jgi:hypothetical protein
MYSCFLHQYNWPARYNWNNVESGIKYHSPNASHTDYAERYLDIFKYLYEKYAY